MEGTAARKERALEAAVGAGLVGEERLLAGFLDLEGIGASVAALKAAFPEGCLHTFAAKANCLDRVLTLLRGHGMGCEAASPGELQQALKAGFAPERIVFDSPAKTRAEIRFALERGIALNIDNFQELARVDAVMAETRSISTIGVRVNPQVGVGAIAAMSTASRTSKFGIALDDPGNRARIVHAFRERPWLSCIHTHVGSQGCPLELIAHGVSKALELADEINAAGGRRQVRVLDVGGGLPVNFDGEEMRPSFEDYAGELRRAVPALFDGPYRLVTEFGRSLLAKNGFIAARVEYTKESGGRRIAITHAGAQVATRTVFMPEMWAIRISAFDRHGRPKRGEPVPQDVAGPCCFAGDIIAHQRRLPLLEPDDIVLAHDTGAYYFSTPFQYNSLPRPAVWGFTIGAGGRVEFEPVRAEETIEEVLAGTAAPV